MIFSPPMARAIAAGRKTMCRVVVREPRLTRRSIRVNGQRRYYGPEYWSTPFEPQAGAVVKVREKVRNEHGRLVTRATDTRVLITDERREFLGDITLVDALAEGHRTTAEFKVAWVLEHDQAWVARQVELAEERGEALITPDDDVLLARFDRRHAGRRVWAVRFAIDRERAPLYLARQSRGSGDYTTSPAKAIDDRDLDGRVLEVVDSATLERFASEAQDANELRRAAYAALLDQAPLRERLDRAVQLARARNVDLSKDVRVAVELLRTGRLDAAARRLVAMEQRLQDRAA